MRPMNRAATIQCACRIIGYRLVFFIKAFYLEFHRLWIILNVFSYFIKGFFIPDNMLVIIRLPKLDTSLLACPCFQPSDYFTKRKLRIFQCDNQMYMVWHYNIKIKESVVCLERIQSGFYGRLVF